MLVLSLSHHAKRNHSLLLTMKSVFLVFTFLLLTIGCSEEEPWWATASTEPAALFFVCFPSSPGPWDSYVPGDTVTFCLSNANHTLEQLEGKVCAGGVPVIEFNRIDSVNYDASVGLYVEHKTSLDYVATLDNNRRIIRCIIRDIPEISLQPGNVHQWRLLLTLATGNPYSNTYGPFYLRTQ